MAKFGGEVAIRFQGLEGRDKPAVFVFPELLICLNCGNADFAISEAELRVLLKRSNTAGA